MPYPPSPYTSPKPAARLRRRILALTGLGLAGLVAGLLSACSSSHTTAPSGDPTATAYTQLAGNWRFSTGSSPAANQLSTLGGSLSVSGPAVTGTLHPLVPGQCLASTELIPVTGAITTEGALTLSGTTASGTTVHLSGTVAADRHSLEAPAITSAGGACLVSTVAAVHSSSAPRGGGTGPTAQQYQPLAGKYSGTLLTAEGETFTLSTTITQLDQPDSSGIYHIQGTATSPGNSCLPNTVTATASDLSGGAVSATYTEPSSATAIIATGSASPDGSTLTLAWQLTSPCGSDSGTGTLTLH